MVSLQPLAVARSAAVAEALFREARRRERRRRLGVVLIVSALAAGGTVLGEWSRGGSSPLVPLPAPSFARVASRATTSASTAHISFVYGQRLSPFARFHRVSTITQGSGTIDFASHKIAFISTQTLEGIGSPKSTPIREVEVGGVFYSFSADLEKGMTRQAIQLMGPLARKPWLAESSKAGGSSLRTVLTSADLLDILQALSGSVRATGQTTIGGTSVTEYESHTTLAAFLAVTKRGFGPPFAPNGGPLVPNAHGIAIPVRLWLDSDHRLVQLQATEPLYAGTYLGNSGQRAEQVPSSYLKSLRQQGFITVTVNLSDFGEDAAISAPPPSEVVTSSQLNRASQGT